MNRNYDFIVEEQLITSKPFSNELKELTVGMYRGG